MKYVLLTHKHYKSASVLVSTRNCESAAALVGQLTARLIRDNAEVVGAILANVPGHHFVEDVDFTYQAVIKTP